MCLEINAVKFIDEHIIRILLVFRDRIFKFPGGLLELDVVQHVTDQLEMATLSVFPSLSFDWNRIRSVHQSTSSIDLIIGTSPFIAGLRGSTIGRKTAGRALRGREKLVVGAGRKGFTNSVTLGDIRAGEGGLLFNGRIGAKDCRNGFAINS